MQGWRRKMCFSETGRPWVMPSPNMPTPDTATVYPGMCLLEGTNVSEGRGTEHPFKWFGAPWIDGKILSQELNKLHLPGVVFVPKSFTPISIPGVADKPKYENQLCDGIEIRVITRNKYQSLNVGVSVLKKLQELVAYRAEHMQPNFVGIDKMQACADKNIALKTVKKYAPTLYERWYDVNYAGDIY